MPKRKNNNSKKRKFPVKAGVIFSAVLLGGIILISSLKHFFSEFAYFRISKVVIEGVPEEGYLELKQRLLGKNIFSYNLKSIKYALEGLFPEVECSGLSRRLPNELVISLRKRQGIAQLKLSRFYLVDRSGMILDKISDSAFSSLPVIHGLQNKLFHPQTGMTYNLNELNRILELIQRLNDSRGALREYAITKVNAVSADSGSFFIARVVPAAEFPAAAIGLAPEVEVKFSLDKPGETVKVLELLLAKHKSGLSNIEYIDIRNVNSPAVLEKKTAGR